MPLGGTIGASPSNIGASPVVRETYDFKRGTLFGAVTARSKDSIPYRAPPAGNYASATVQSNPTSDLTDFTLIVDLSDLPAGWWSDVSVADGTRGRVWLDDLSRELACDWIDFDKDNSTGLLRCLLPDFTTSGTHIIRIYPPKLSRAAEPADGDFGQYAAYDANWAGYWPLQAGAADRTANARDAVATGSPTIGGVAGKFGKATDLNGSSQYIKATYQLAQPFTVLCWVNQDSTASTLLCEFDGTDGTDGFKLYGSTSGANTNFRAQSYGPTASAYGYYNGVAANGNWVHVGAVFKSNTSRTPYVNGAAGTEDTTDSGTPTPDSDLGLGVDPRYDTSPLSGQTQDWQVHDVERAAEWIATERNQTNDNAAFWGTWTWSGSAGGHTATVAATTGGITAAATAAFTPSTDRTATAAITTGGIGAAATATYDSGTFVATAAPSTGAVAAAATASYDPGTFVATAAPTTGGVTAAATATNEAPEYLATAAPSTGGVTASATASYSSTYHQATVAASTGGVTAAATATYSAGASVATVAAVTGGATAAATATNEAPAYVATVAVTTGGASASATASYSSTYHQAGVAVTTGGVTAAATATYGPGSKTATVAVTTGGVSAAATATNEVPEYLATAAVTTGGATAAATATYGPPEFHATVHVTTGGVTASSVVTYDEGTFTATSNITVAPVVCSASVFYIPFLQTPIVSMAKFVLDSQPRFKLDQQPRFRAKGRI